MRRIASLVTCLVAVGIAGAPVAATRTATGGGQRPPGSPTNVVVTSGDGQAIVSFDAPSSGGPVDHYVVAATNNLGSNPSAQGKKSPITIGLNNGGWYTVSVTAVNAAGYSAATPGESTAFPTGTPGLVPGPPTGVTAVAGDGQATISYQAPVLGTDDYVVWGYMATATNLTSPGDGGQSAQVGFGGNVTQNFPPTPMTIGNLTNGDEYAFTVVTVITGDANPTFDSSLGSAQSELSNTVTPGRAPDAPKIGNVTPGDEQAAVQFSPPASDGGLPITTYTVTADNWSEPNLAPVQGSGTGSPVTVTELLNGDTYGFTVTATNAAGTSPPSESAGPVTLPLEPGQTPGAPTAVIAIAGNAEATVSFEAPATGGKPDSYTVVALDTFQNRREAEGRKSPITITGLSNNTQWSVSVRANNEAGSGPAAPGENVFFPSADASSVAPDPPTDVTVVPGDGQATVSYKPPVRGVDDYYVWAYIAVAVDLTNPANGGQYAQTGFGGGPPFDDAPPNPMTIGNLTNGDLYAFSVITVNTGDADPTFDMVISSAPSELSAPVIIAGPPDAPKIGRATAGDGEASVTFSPPVNDGGAPIIDYTVTAEDETDHRVGGQAATGPDSPIVVGTLTDGHTYTFTVVARTAAGVSRPSQATEPVVPEPPVPTDPGAPTGVRGEAGEGQATVSWVAPDTGHSPILGYTVTAFDQTAPGRGGQSVASASTSATVKGLTAGDRYVFRVSATNAVGTGPLSNPSDPVVPKGAERGDDPPRQDEPPPGDDENEPGTTTSPTGGFRRAHRVAAGLW